MAPRNSPTSTRKPVSSTTSRRAPATGRSSGLSLPRGSTQSLSLLRWTTATLGRAPLRTAIPPTACIVLFTNEPTPIGHNKTRRCANRKPNDGRSCEQRVRDGGVGRAWRQAACEALTVACPPARRADIFARDPGRDFRRRERRGRPSDSLAAPREEQPSHQNPADNHEDGTDCGNRNAAGGD